jgi:hypothetical protein
MLLTQNRELRQDGVWNFTLPAWVVELPDGSHFNVCPNAGACAKFCYARNGTYLFPKVRGKHLRNLEIAQSPDFQHEMGKELAHKRMRPTGQWREVPGLPDTSHLSHWVNGWITNGGQAVRIHDSGDFFSEYYYRQWINLAWEYQDILFYAYTKEVRLTEHLKTTVKWPDNLLTIYSMGGKQDHLVDKDTMRHADVFPDLESIKAAGYMSQHQSDLLCVLLPTTRVGIPQNNIPHFKKRLNGRTFSEAQQDRTRKTAIKSDNKKETV